MFEIYQKVPELEYDYHDSICGLCKMIDEKSIQLQFDLYPVFYPEKPVVIMNLYGIINIESAQKYFSSKFQDEEQLNSDNYTYFGRVDSIQYDSKMKSKPGDLFILFDIDPYGHFAVHCKAIEIIKAAKD